MFCKLASIGSPVTHLDSMNGAYGAGLRLVDTWRGEPLTLGLEQLRGPGEDSTMSQEAQVQTTLWCSQCGRALGQSDLVQIAGNWVCADCKPAFLSRVMASGAAGASRLTWRYGGFWIRFGARFIDGLIFMVPVMIFFIVFIPDLVRSARQPSNPANPFNGAITPVTIIGFFLLIFLAGACYEILMLKYRSATLGKMACGLKVIRPDGRSLSWGV